MSTSKSIWTKLRKSKKYREEFVAAFLKRAIPLQMRALRKQRGLSQQMLAERAGVTQGVISRAEDPGYGNLTLNTIIRIAAGFDVAFAGKFVPFSEFAHWAEEMSEASVPVRAFEEEDELFGKLVVEPTAPEGAVTDAEMRPAAPGNPYEVGEVFGLRKRPTQVLTGTSIQGKQRIWLPEQGGYSYEAGRSAAR